MPLLFKFLVSWLTINMNWPWFRGCSNSVIDFIAFLSIIFFCLHHIRRKIARRMKGLRHRRGTHEVRSERLHRTGMDCFFSVIFSWQDRWWSTSSSFGRRSSKSSFTSLLVCNRFRCCDRTFRVLFDCRQWSSKCALLSSCHQGCLRDKSEWWFAM